MFELHRAEWRTVGSECNTRTLFLPEVSPNINLNSSRAPVRGFGYTATSVKASWELVGQCATLSSEEGDVCKLSVYSWGFVRVLGVRVKFNVMFSRCEKWIWITWNCNCVRNKRLSGWRGRLSRSRSTRELMCCYYNGSYLSSDCFDLFYIGSAWLRFTYTQVTHCEKTTPSAVIVDHRVYCHLK